MRPILCQIMSNDSIREIFRKEYPYENGLGISQKETETEKEMGQLPFIRDFIEWLGQIFEDFVLFLTRVPAFVWIIIGIVLAAVLFVWMYRSGLLGYRRSKADIPLADDIYEIDFDPELSAALSAGDYAGALRIRYLQTLRYLVDEGRVAWEISKTPTQFAKEAGDISFNTMTRHFLWVRYGKYPAPETLYRKVEQLAIGVSIGMIPRPCGTITAMSLWV